MIKITFKPQRKEFDLLMGEYASPTQLILHLEKLINLESTIDVPNGIIAVWIPNNDGLRIQSNTFIGYSVA